MQNIDSDSKLGASPEMGRTHGMVVFVRGLPGSGKTSLSSMINENLLHGRVEQIDPDLVDKNNEAYIGFCRELKITNPEIDEKLYMYRYLLNKAKSSLSEAKIVIWSQPFTGLENFVYTLEQFRNVSSIQIEDILIVDIMLDKEIARNRMKKRKENGGHGPNDEYFDKLANQFQKADTLGYNYLCIDTSMGFEEPLGRVLEKIKKHV